MKDRRHQELTQNAFVVKATLASIIFLVNLLLKKKTLWNEVYIFLKIIIS